MRFPSRLVALGWLSAKRTLPAEFALIRCGDLFEKQSQPNVS